MRFISDMFNPFFIRMSFMQAWRNMQADKLLLLFVPLVVQWKHYWMAGRSRVKASLKN